MYHPIDYKIMYQAPFFKEDIHLEFLVGKKKLKEHTKKQINEVWKNYQLNPKKITRNYILYTLVSSAMTISNESDKNTLYLKLQESDYKSFIGTNLVNPGNLPPTELISPLRVIAIVETTNGCIFAGMRKLNQSDEELWQLPGSFLDEKTNPVIFMKNKLRSMLNIDDNDIQFIVCLGMAENLIDRVSELICYLHVNMSDIDMISKMKGGDLYGGGNEFYFAPTEDLEYHVQIHPYSPQSKAAIQLYIDYIMDR